MGVKTLLSVVLLVTAGSTLPVTGGTDSSPGLSNRGPGLVLRVAQAKADQRIPRCRPGPVKNYLESSAERCWYDAPHGRWRTLRHELHYDVVVIEVEAESLEDADEIVRRFVENLGDSGVPSKDGRVRFREVMVYVQEASASQTSPIRRIRWTRKGGYDTLTFVGSLRR